MQNMTGEKMTIGWREWLRLPALNIPAIKAKIDTGAKTSALHAFDLTVFEEGNRQRVRFGIRPLRRNKELILFCVADILGKRMITDSGGHRELRHVIRTDIDLGGMVWPIDITLTRRDTMKFRMLLGRTALQDRFLIDPGKSYLTGRALAKYYSTSSSRKAKQ